MPPASQPTVAIAGGGLAGLAAACALSDAGFRVTLFEKRPFLGGRASSWEHPGTGEVVDNCQHVLFRLCTNLIEFYDRIGVADQIRWYDEMTFIEPGGRASVMKSSPLPAPLHTAPSFLAFQIPQRRRQTLDLARPGPAHAHRTARHRKILSALARSSRPNPASRRALLASDPGQRSQRGTRPDFHLRRRSSRPRVHDVSRRAPHGSAHRPAHRSLQRRRRLRPRPRRHAPLPPARSKDSPTESQVQLQLRSQEDIGRAIRGEPGQRSCPIPLVTG